jgi:putative phage-type endonuclease
MELLSFSESEYIKKNRKKVKALQKKNHKCPEQRSPEWFAARNTRITASEAASCLFKSKKVCEAFVQEFNLTNFKYKDTERLNPYETREDYIIKKCESFNGVNVFKDSIFTMWGKKYEEVANRLYCKLYNTQVIEFGLMPHSRLKWLAASPDGITPDGIMLEIKCPKARKIDDNVPPFYYWIQTQIQMEVVDLDFCDFFECEIAELNEDEFIEQKLEGKQDKGIVLQIIEPENQNTEKKQDPKFLYPPIHLNTTEDYINWKNENMQKFPNTYIPTYYFVTKYNNIRIKRSKEWFNNVKEDLKKTWQLITNLQNNKEDFEKYKQSIFELKNKDFINKYNNTECLIHHDHNSTFVFAQPTIIEENDEVVNLDNLTSNSSVNCLID